MKVVDCDGEIFGHYDWVISSIPAEQSLKLLPDYFSHYDALKQKKMLGCYSLMLGFDEALDLDWDAAQLTGRILVGFQSTALNQDDRMIIVIGSFH